MLTALSISTCWAPSAWDRVKLCPGSSSLSRQTGCPVLPTPTACTVLFHRTAAPGIQAGIQQVDRALLLSTTSSAHVRSLCPTLISSCSCPLLLFHIRVWEPWPGAGIRRSRVQSPVCSCALPPRGRVPVSVYLHASASCPLPMKGRNHQQNLKPTPENLPSHAYSPYHIQAVQFPGDTP